MNQRGKQEMAPNVIYSDQLLESRWPMKCEGCGAELAEGVKTCSACGRAVSFGERATAETAHVAKETGVVVGKVGRGIVGGVKAFGAGAKKGYKGSEEEKKE